MSCFDDWNGYDHWRLDSPDDKEEVFVCDKCFKEYPIEDMIQADGRELCEACMLEELNEDDLD
jgi:formylmethanofuran dehydrogenase subunit E